MVIVINSVIGGFSWVDLVWLAASTVWLQVSNNSQLSNYTVRYNCTEWLEKYKAADAPITFEEIVMVMITYVISISYVTSSFVISSSFLDVLCS